MSKFVDAAATSHTLSVTAMEEASRFGQRTADIDHLFLALVVNEQLAGQVLRSMGITLGSARAAVAGQHAEQIASLGVDAELPGQGPIVFHETRGYDWSERSVEIIKRANGGRKRGDAAAVLRELVAEPSGLIAAILQRLDVTAQAVIDNLDEAERLLGDATPRSPAAPGALSGTRECFVPAAVEEVWELLADAARLPEWDSSIGAVEDVPSDARPGDAWTARTATCQPDGTPIRVKPGFETQRVELLTRQRCQRLAWLFTLPDAADANARRVQVELAPAAGGTQLVVSLAWVPRPGRRRSAIRWLMRPLTRLTIWMQLSHLAGGISRAFR